MLQDSASYRPYKGVLDYQAGGGDVSEMSENTGRKREGAALTEREIQQAIMSWKRARGLMAPNVTLSFGEADFLLVTWAGWAYEYEIKASRQDFLRDLKKDRSAAYRMMFTDQRPISQYVPNYFTYIIAEGVNVGPSDIPEWAGAYFVGPSPDEYGPLYRFTPIKRQTRLHTEKLDWTMFMAKSLSYRFCQHYIVERELRCPHCGKSLMTDPDY